MRNNIWRTLLVLRVFFPLVMRPKSSRAVSSTKRWRKVIFSKNHCHSEQTVAYKPRRWSRLSRGSRRSWNAGPSWDTKSRILNRISGGSLSQDVWVWGPSCGCVRGADAIGTEDTIIGWDSREERDDLKYTRIIGQWDIRPIYIDLRKEYKV